MQTEWSACEMHCLAIRTVRQNDDFCVVFTVEVGPWNATAITDSECS